MNFLRNRLVVLGLVLLGTVLLYLLLPSIRPDTMEQSFEPQRTGLLAAAAPLGPRPLMCPFAPDSFLETPAVLPRSFACGSRRAADTAKAADGPSAWPGLYLQNLGGTGNHGVLAANGYQALAMDLPGYGKSPDSEALKTEQNRVDLLSRFMESLGVRAAVLLSPSMSGHYSIPFLMKNSAQLRGFVPVAPVGTRSYSAQQYKKIQTPTLIVYGALDTNLGAQSHKNLIQLPKHEVLKLEGARHACYMDKPREFHQGLIKFLDKLRQDI